MKLSDKIYIFLIVGLHFLYFIFALTIAETHTLDSDEYIKTGENILLHFTSYNGQYSSSFKPELYHLRPPFYGLFLSITSLFGSFYKLSLLIQNILSIYLWLKIGQFVKRSTDSKVIYPCIFFSLILFPVQLIMVNQFMADFLLEFVFFFAFLNFVKFTENSDLKYWIILNVLLGVAVLIKPILLYFWVPIFGFSIQFYFKDKNVKIWLGAALLPLVILCWSWRNYYHTGQFEFTSIQHQLALEANIQHMDIAKYGYEVGHLNYKKIDKEVAALPNYADRIKTIHRIEKERISDNPFMFIKLYANGFINGLLNPGRLEFNLFFKLTPKKEVGLFTNISSRGFQGLIAYLHSINIMLILFLIVGFIFQLLLFISQIFLLSKVKVLNIESKFFIGVTILYALSASGVFGFARFKLLYFPFLFIGFVFFCDYLLQKYYKNSSKLMA